MNDFNPRKKGFAEEIGYGVAERAQREAFIRLRPEECALLREMRSVVEAFAGTFVQQFYEHLLRTESEPFSSRPAAEQRLLAGHERLGGVTGVVVRPALLDSARASQVALLDEDRRAGHDIFPAGHLDADLQQVDLRERNSWRLALDEVSAVELLEVHLVNAVVPFVLNARLKPLMLRDRTFDKHIVNVSAMEGQFYRTYKTDKHPHTNMAKASLNMMTRTSAADYVKDGIHMNSVDTGWITDEDAVALAERKHAEHGFVPPLDVVDGAARILDPIFSGFLTGVSAPDPAFTRSESACP